MHRALLATVAAIALFATSVRAQVDHLTCFKTKDSQKFDALATLDALQDDFDAGQCRIKGKASLFCVPSSKQVDDFTVDKQPGTLLPVSGIDPQQDHVCYKIKCPKATIPDAEVSDQFGARTLGKFKAQLVCVPAVKSGACPSDMVDTGSVCIDRYEAPNQAGDLPLVMYTFNEAEAWCTARGKRLCYDDEWESTCEGAPQTAYPYGDVHQPGVCNDEEIFIVYNQTLLNGWPSEASSTTIESLANLFAAASGVSQAGADAADHVASLYQGEGSGDNPGCVSDTQVFDLTGNVEEWTRRRDGGSPGFSGNLKGRYWAESRTCQDDVTAHGDAFRFYEIGFRCCADLQ